MKTNSPHSFHIPVMGLGFTIDSPVKVARFGITSVLSIIEDHLIEAMREVLCKKENIAYHKIETHEDDHRARRVTAFLNLQDDIIKKQISKIKSEDFNADEDINKYFEMLPDTREEKQLYMRLNSCSKDERLVIETRLKESITAGAIDVNIMTKLDKINYVSTETNYLPNNRMLYRP